MAKKFNADAVINQALRGYKKHMQDTKKAIALMDVAYKNDEKKRYNDQRKFYLLRMVDAYKKMNASLHGFEECIVLFPNIFKGNIFQRIWSFVKNVFFSLLSSYLDGDDLKAPLEERLTKLEAYAMTYFIWSFSMEWHSYQLQTMGVDEALYDRKIKKNIAFLERNHTIKTVRKIVNKATDSDSAVFQKTPMQAIKDIIKILNNIIFCGKLFLIWGRHNHLKRHFRSGFKKSIKMQKLLAVPARKRPDGSFTKISNLCQETKYSANIAYRNTTYMLLAGKAAALASETMAVALGLAKSFTPGNKALRRQFKNIGESVLHYITHDLTSFVLNFLEGILSVKSIDPNNPRFVKRQSDVDKMNAMAIRAGYKSKTDPKLSYVMAETIGEAMPIRILRTQERHLASMLQKKYTGPTLGAVKTAMARKRRNARRLFVPKGANRRRA